MTVPKTSRQLPSLLPKRLISEHVKVCKKSRCRVCQWHEFGQKTAHNPPKWLKLGMSKKHVGLGCTDCALANLSGPWAEFQQSPARLTQHVIRRHESSRSHVAAARKQVSGPDLDELRAMLKHMRQGGSARQGGVASDKKTKMRFALSEAVLAKHRSDLMRARSICLLRDERKGRLLLRFRACLGDLTVTQGVLGLKGVEGSADSIAQVTLRAVTDFCTPCRGLPRDCHSPQIDGPQGTPLACHVKDHVQFLVTDAAPNELLSSEQLRGRRRGAAAAHRAPASEFKNVRVVGRDGAHAATRVLKNPFTSHAFINDIMDEFVSASDSFSQKVRNSSLFAMWWNEEVTGPGSDDDNDEGGEPRRKNSANLSAAKRRFGSLLNPLSKLSKNLQAMLNTCQRIEAVRGSGSSWATSILKSFTGRKALAIAMASDAAATVMDFCRFMDTESADIAQINYRAQSFLLAGHALFTEKKVFSLPTYTKTMLDQIQGQPLTVMSSGDAPRQVQVTEQDKAAVLKVFQEWMQAAESTLAAEFPDWHILSCFDVFHLEERRASAPPDHLDDCLAKLANCFKVRLPDLKKQYAALLPIATQLYKVGERSNRAAWQAALQQGGRVLCGYLAWTPSTSGVEQLFSKVKRSPVELTSSMEVTDMRLCVVMGMGDLTQPEEDEILQSGQRIYTAMLKSQLSYRRKPGKRRIDKGVPKGQTRRSTGSQAAWHRARKAAVAKAAEELKTPPRRPPLELPESLAKEESRQRALEKKRKADALGDGYLLPKEITPGLEAYAAKKQKQDLANDKSRGNKFHEYEAVRKTSRQAPHETALKDLPRRDLREGDLYLVNDFTAVHRKVRAMAALRGGVILSGGVLEGRPGVKVTFSRGLDLPVAVYVTDEFKREEPGLTLILRHACSNGWQAVGADGVRGSIVRRQGPVVAMPPTYDIKQLVVKVNSMAATWRQRLSPHSTPMPKDSFRVASDCTGYGSELIALTLLGLRRRVKCVMSSDSDVDKTVLHGAVARSCGISTTGARHYTDVLARDDLSAPSADLYVAGYPCPSYSQLGKQLGPKDCRGLVTLKGLLYIAAQRPRVVVLEQVAALMTHQKHRKVWEFILKTLNALSYYVQYRVMSPKDYGIPQSRDRLYLFAVVQESLAQELTLPGPRLTASDLHCFLDKDKVGNEVLQLPKYERLLGRAMWLKGYILDVAASERFQCVLTNVSPCLTRTRLKGTVIGFYIPKLKRRLLTSECARLQGLPAQIWRNMAQSCQEERLAPTAAAAALGDAMALNCLMTVLRRALDASGLATLGSRKDYWLNVPAGRSAAEMSSNSATRRRLALTGAGHGDGPGPDDVVSEGHGTKTSTVTAGTGDEQRHGNDARHIAVVLSHGDAGQTHGWRWCQEQGRQLAEAKAKATASASSSAGGGAPPPKRRRRAKSPPQASGDNLAAAAAAAASAKTMPRCIRILVMSYSLLALGSSAILGPPSSWPSPTTQTPWRAMAQNLDQLRANLQRLVRHTQWNAHYAVELRLRIHWAWQTIDAADQEMCHDLFHEAQVWVPELAHVGYIAPALIRNFIPGIGLGTNLGKGRAGYYMEIAVGHVLYDDLATDTTPRERRIFWWFVKWSDDWHSVLQDVQRLLPNWNWKAMTSIQDLEQLRCIELLGSNFRRSDQWAVHKDTWQSVLLSVPCSFLVMPQSGLRVAAFNRRQAVLQQHESMARTGMQTTIEVTHLRSMLEAANPAAQKMNHAQVASELTAMGLKSVVAGRKASADDDDSGSVTGNLIANCQAVSKSVLVSSRCVELLMAFEQDWGTRSPFHKLASLAALAKKPSSAFFREWALESLYDAVANRLIHVTDVSKGSLLGDKHHWDGDVTWMSRLKKSGLGAFELIQSLVYDKKYDNQMRMAAKQGGSPEQVMEFSDVADAWAAVKAQLANEEIERKAAEKLEGAGGDENDNEDAECVESMRKAPNNFPMNSGPYWRAVANQTLRTYITLAVEPKTQDMVTTAVETCPLKDLKADRSKMDCRSVFRPESARKDASPDAEEKEVIVAFDDESMRLRKKLSRGCYSLRSTLLFYSKSPLIPDVVPEKQYDSYGSWNTSDMVGFVKALGPSSLWHASREDKVAILSDARAVTPTDAATAKNEAADDGSVMSSQSVFSCQTLPTDLYREVLKAHSCKGVIDLSAGQGQLARAAICDRLPYWGLCLTEAHCKQLEVQLTKFVFDEMRREGSTHYRPECCSGGDDDQQKPPAPKPKPKPTNRPRKEAGGSGKGEADDDKKVPKPKSQSKDTTPGGTVTRVATTTAPTVKGRTRCHGRCGLTVTETQGSKPPTGVCSAESRRQPDTD
ncbi:Modification methylase NlaIV (M.NlaIV) (Cytosine-specific methyltransferase NlaIV) [Durusdinium trenchii]|uniref:Modification methylase NlaIV (M.NlaIV) (Cytosine-specific methyltransferase NlaIV) n=1 Tax=Durusdinium trenchii TaxID=1381693 RepID=A0ABP0MXC6_9DINO